MDNRKKFRWKENNKDQRKPVKNKRIFVVKDLYYGQNGFDNSYGNQFSSDILDKSGYDKYMLDMYIPGREKLNDSFDKIRSEDIPHNGASPVVIFIHGGGWRRGDRSAWKHYTSYLDTNVLVAVILRLFKLYGNIGAAFAESGIACAIVSYPLSKLSTFWVLFEMLTSYIMSAMFVVPILSLLLLTLRTIFQHFHYFYVHLDSDYFKSWFQILFLSLTSVNLIIAGLMTVFRQRYALSVAKVTILWTLITCVSCCYKLLGPIGLPYYPLFFFLTTLVCTQGILFHTRVKHRGVTYREQIKAIRDAVNYVKKYGSENEAYDINRIYLMGHSAGGHLVTLLTLQSALTDSDLRDRDLNIQGVISISGVLDLPKLNKSVLKPLYLYPTFGRDHSEWTKASPTHVIPAARVDDFGRHVTDKLPCDLPPFLLITAEKDLHLQDDAEVLAKKIKLCGGRCFLKTICPSNHFTIVWDFKADPSASNTKLTQICTDFILRTSQFDIDLL